MVKSGETGWFLKCLLDFKLYDPWVWAYHGVTGEGKNIKEPSDRPPGLSEENQSGCCVPAGAALPRDGEAVQGWRAQGLEPG